jgi:hypothetical protein
MHSEVISVGGCISVLIEKAQYYLILIVSRVAIQTKAAAAKINKK